MTEVFDNLKKRLFQRPGHSDEEAQPASPPPASPTAPVYVEVRPNDNSANRLQQLLKQSNLSDKMAAEIAWAIKTQRITTPDELIRFLTTTAPLDSVQSQIEELSKRPAVQRQVSDMARRRAMLNFLSN